MTQKITEQVGAYLDNDFVIRHCLEKNIISLRALSRQIGIDLGLKEGNLDAILSAVRRYKKSQSKSGNTKFNQIFSHLAIKTRSNVANIRVRKNRKSVDAISKIGSLIDIEKGEMLMAIQSEQSITLIMDAKNTSKFLESFQKPDILSSDMDLTAINLLFTEEAQQVKSIVAAVTSSFSAEGINIVEIMSSAPELILIIKKEDMLRAMGVLQKLTRLSGSSQ